jgi:hypothetical protein
MAGDDRRARSILALISLLCLLAFALAPAGGRAATVVAACCDNVLITVSGVPNPSTAGQAVNILVTVCQVTFTSNTPPPVGSVVVTQSVDPTSVGAPLGQPALTSPTGACNLGTFTTTFSTPGNIVIQADDYTPQVPGPCSSARDFGVSITGTLPNYNAGCATYTQTVTAPAAVTVPAAPANIRAAAVDSTHIRIDWTNVPPDGDSVQIVDGTLGSLIKTVSGDATSSVLVNLVPGSEYCVYLIAVNQAGSSPPSDQACAVTPQ